MKFISEMPKPFPDDGLLIVPGEKPKSKQQPTYVDLSANPISAQEILTLYKEYDNVFVLDPVSSETPKIETLGHDEIIDLARRLQRPFEGTREQIINQILKGFREAPANKIYNPQTGKFVAIGSAEAKRLTRVKATHTKRQPTPFFSQPYEAYSWQPTGQVNEGDKHWILPNSRGFQMAVRDKFPLIKMPPMLSTTDELHSHQKIVKDYLHPSTPYRGILAYHGLGGGKTRLAIEIAEDFRDHNYQILLFTPASLQTNFREEIRRWGRPDLRTAATATLTTEELIMSNHKIDQYYHFVNYNGTPLKTLRDLNIYYDSGSNTYYPPENAFIVIEEVHNLIHNMTSESSVKAKQMLELLKRAKNCKFLAMSGTPMVESPLELVMLFNILRGPMYDPRSKQHIFFFPEDEERFREYFISTTPQGDQTLTGSRIEQFKRRIMGMVSYYPGGNEPSPRSLYPEILTTAPNLFPPDIVFCPMGKRQLEEYKIIREIEEARDRRARISTALSLDDNVKPTFRIHSRRASNFVFPADIQRPSKGAIMSEESIQRFHLSTKLTTGDASLWTESQTKALLLAHTLLENLDQLHDEKKADWDELLYRLNRAKTSADRTRIVEQTLATNLPKLLEQRLATPTITTLMEGDIKGWIDYASKHRTTLTEQEAIVQSLERLRASPHVFTRESLQDLSPKFLKMWEAVRDGPKPILVYSNFKTLEGIGIFAILLEHMGYRQFKARDFAHTPAATDPSLIEDAPRYALFTGDTDSSGGGLDERSYVLRVFNHPSNQTPITDPKWPTSKLVDSSNNRGSKIQIILGTSAVAEGLNIMGVRQLLATETHWTMVRIEQVLGRTKRYLSHKHLPLKDRTVVAKMFLSIDPKDQTNIPKWMEQVRSQSMTQIEFSERTRDTTDLFIYNVALRKKQLSDQLLKLLQQASIDCQLSQGCLEFPESDHKLLSYYPNYLEDPLELPKPQLIPSHEIYLPFLPPTPQPALLFPDGTPRFYFKKSERESGQLQMRLYRKEDTNLYRPTPYLIEQTAPETFRLIRG